MADVRTNPFPLALQGVERPGFTIGTWNPTDISGAGLALTVIYAKWWRYGRMVYFWCSVTYPATASGAGAAIGGLPVLPEQGVAVAVNAIGAAAAITGRVTTLGAITVSKPGAANALNSDLSNINIQVSGFYLS